jgi:hypothetical protein
MGKAPGKREVKASPEFNLVSIGQDSWFWAGLLFNDPPTLPASARLRR